MILKTKAATGIEVWEVDLSAFIADTYGRPWRMQQGEMLGQNTYREIDVDPEQPDGWLPEEAQQLLDEWLALPHPGTDSMDFERDHYLPVDILLWDLCRRGFAPAGAWLIKVWW